MKRQPVNVATVARALVLLFNESARVVDPADYQLYTRTDWSKLRPRDGERFIQAVRFRLRVPEVVTLIGYDRLPTAAVTLSRRNIFKRDRYTCQCCGVQPGTEKLTLDHVVGSCVPMVYRVLTEPPECASRWKPRSKKTREVA